MYQRHECTAAMVLYDPMERPLLQLVTSHPATDKKLFPRRAPPWAGDISQLSNAQLDSAIAFTEFMTNNVRGSNDAQGTSSFRGNQVSNSALMVMRNYPNTGIGAFGGDTPQERRQNQYDQADANLQRLQNERQQRAQQ